MIDVSGPSRRYVESQGGDAFVFFRDIGSWTVQRVATSRPDGIEFDEHPVGSIRAWLQADFAPPERMKLRRRPWPFGPLDAFGAGPGRSGALDGGSDGDGSSRHWPALHDGGHGHGDFGGGHGGH
jgi:hypothetical protein